LRVPVQVLELGLEPAPGLRLGLGPKLEPKLELELELEPLHMLSSIK
jgi:hypothetical protein